MNTKLFFEAITKVVLGILLVGALLFLPAGTWNYPGGWLLMGILFVPMVIAGIVMMLKNPELLRKRLNAKEKEQEQNLVVKLSGLMFLAYPLIIAKRIANEEKVLEEGLEGYKEYKQKIKWRLIPFVW